MKEKKNTAKIRFCLKSPNKNIVLREERSKKRGEGGGTIGTNMVDLLPSKGTTFASEQRASSST